ncbi:restriction endonuclease S subunit [Candidatus Methanoperedens nitroreducens]|uniref:Restriction endonuclease S subunit n=1 Tax=Candidatus Methanoperedens nitratireducens TaxID=1392998 RepID=A0A062V611_9EURY|nr:restriction endonuclease subunit S [Candidatus Methanoperedens nitroreducens]KCZ72003.1 restriction endonuclease S subunit [Candidatus Methanoperedens nitroreducens]MDJ1422021.1 restriction endonuclease subunit S [Candidatus Methanoperedens sp.]
MGNDKIKDAETGVMHQQEVIAHTWTTCTIQDLLAKGEAEVKTGPFGTQLHASDYVEQGTPVINARNIGFGDIRPDKLEFISEETVQSLSSHLLEPNDIVFGRKGTVERHAFIRKEHTRWFQGTDCLRLRLKSPSIDPRFVSYCFLIEAHKRWMINQSSHGSTMTSLNQDIIGRILLRLPPFDVQKKIVAILSAYDDLIENNTRRIKILEEMAQALYREWFVRFKFPGHEKVRMVESELGMVPEGWEVKKLGEVCNILMGQSPKSEFYNDTGEGLLFHQGVTDFGDRFPIDRMYCTVQNRIAEAGDILFSVRAPVGRINIADKKIIIGRGLCAIRSRSGNQAFVFQQLKEQFKEEDSMGGGTIFKSVTKDDMQGIKFLVPSEVLIKSFEDITVPIFTELKNLTIKNTNLRRTRDLLLPKLISGEVDLEKLEVNIPTEAV